MVKRKMSTGKIIAITAGSLLVLFLFSGGCFFLGFLSSSFGTVPAYRQGNIYEIRIEGVITATEQSGLFGGGATTPEEVFEQLDSASDDPAIKAVLLRVNSPGGSPAASQEIYHEVNRMEKPVVVSVSETCASGAYYISCAADMIIANPASSVGSIGVILQIPNLEGLYDKLGVEYTIIKQGKYKDIGNPDRDITAEERRLLEEQTRKLYRQFISDVAESRELSIEEVEELATGWIYLGSEAVKLGLIDDLGTYQDAVDEAARLGEVTGEAVVVSGAKRPSIYDLLLQYYLGSLFQNITEFNPLKGISY